MGVYFLTAALFLLCAVAYFGVAAFQERYVRIRNEFNKEDLAETKSDWVNKYVLFLVPLMSLLHACHLGLEVTYQGLLVSFVVRCLHLSRADASFILSVYYSAYLLGRCLGSLTARHISCSLLLFLNLGIVFTSLLLELLLTPVWSRIIWITAALNGLGSSTVIPASIIWLDTQIRITGNVASIAMVTGSLGMMGIPALTGNLMEKHLAVSIFDVILLSTNIMAILLYVTIFAASKRRQRGQEDPMFDDDEEAEISEHDLDKDREVSVYSGASRSSKSSYRHYSVSRAPSVFGSEGISLRRLSGGPPGPGSPGLDVSRFRQTVTASLINTPMNMRGQTPLVIHRLMG